MKLQRVQAFSANILRVSVAELQHAPKILRAFPQITLYTKKGGVQVVFVQHAQNAENGTLPLASSGEPCIIVFVVNNKDVAK